MRRVLIIGGSGLVGKAILKELNKKEYDVYSTYCNNKITSNNRSSKLNIGNIENVDYVLNKVRPEIIISCVRGNFDELLCSHIKMAEYLKDNGGRMYFFSTTNVFDNDLSKGKYEYDPTDSCTDYGRYKIKCENKLTEILDDNAYILRLPQVLGKDSPRIRQLLNQVKDNNEIVVYPKLFINTNLDTLIAKQLRYIIEHNLKGIFHLSAEDIMSHKEIYSEIIDKLHLNLVTKESFDEQGYFALSSNRTNEFPKELRFTNTDVIKLLLS
jgi:dTDP-4-dehydrorhamnose reductase